MCLLLLLPLESFHYYGTSFTTFPRQYIDDGASTITVLVDIMGQCMLPIIASDMVELNAYTQSDGVHSL